MITFLVVAWGGEEYPVRYDGSVFIDPSTGAEYARLEDAARDVLTAAARAGGQAVDEEEIEGFVDGCLRSAYGDDYLSG